MRFTLSGATPRRLLILIAAALIAPTIAATTPRSGTGSLRDGATVVMGRVSDAQGRPVSQATVSVESRASTVTNAQGRFTLSVPRGREGEVVSLSVQHGSYVTRRVTVALGRDTVQVQVVLQSAAVAMDSIAVSGRVTSAPNASPVPDHAVADHAMRKGALESQVVTSVGIANSPAGGHANAKIRGVGTGRYDDLRRIRRAPIDSGNTEAYDHIDENAFRSPLVAPMSTFSVDVDRASYANVRRFLNGGSLPPKDAVRIEELMNYFPYDDPAPGPGEPPLRITTEVAPAPWNANHDLVRIALRARDIDLRRAPPSNLVFLIDVSGSMMAPNRLPLVKQSLALLVNELRDEDRVAIVVYAGQAGLVLPSTNDHRRILGALERLEAGGSTAGGAGIRLAYDVARQNFLRGGNNRVILCTDGDFNVGQSSDGELVNLIEQRRTEGSYLTILGFGMGNYKDAKMEKLAGAGNGNYAYIDDLLEARKMLVKEMGSTLHTVAKDVKLQVEFDPAKVQAYRLLGYEDRLLRDEDFANDAKDAGDVGAGHHVTALYEIVRSNAELDVELPAVPTLRYQRRVQPDRTPSDELLHVAMRYKAPDGDRSMLVTHPVRAERRWGKSPSESMRFASAVAGFGMLLRHSPNAGSLTWSQVIGLARDARGDDPEGYRADFIRLAEIAASLSRGIAER